jgi:hypothetical protein
MGNFSDFDIEIQDIKDSSPEHFNGTVTTAGTPVTITPSSGKIIQLVLINNPNRGPNANTINQVLLVNIDGGSYKFSVPRGSSFYIPGIFSSFKIDSNLNSTKYEVILWT